MNEQKDKKEEEYEEIESKLIEEEHKDKKPIMPVSGRSVFEIKRIKENKKKD